MGRGDGPRRGDGRRGPARPSLPHAGPGSRDAVERELRHHLDEKVDRLVEQGMSPEAARREAERAFGDVERVRAEVRGVDRTAVPLKWLVGAADAVMRDLAYAVRSLIRAPWLAAAVIVTLGVGIGANVAIFSVVEAVMLRSLPFDEPDRIVYMYELSSRGLPFAVSPANFLDWQERLTSFEAIAATANGGVLVTEAGEPERVPGARVSADYFRVMGMQPFMGRTFTPEEDTPEGADLAVVSHAFWTTRLGSDPDAVGKTMRMDGRPHTIIGVMPPGVRAYTASNTGSPVEVWRPYPFISDPPNVRDIRRLGAVGRLRPGVTPEAAEAELHALAMALVEEYPESNGWMKGATLVPVAEALSESARLPVVVLSVAVGFILLIACLNVGSLFLARADVRRNAITLRRALGASRAAIVRQLLAESLVFSLAGTALGVAVARGLLPVLVSRSPVDVTRIGLVEINGPVLAFSLAVAVLTAVATGLVPAIGSSAPDLVEELKRGGHGRTEGRRARRARSSLVVAEVALSATLVIGAGLMLASYLRLTSLDLGFNPDGVVRVGTLLPRDRYADEVAAASYASWRPRAEELEFIEGVEQGIARLPGVESVGAGNFDALPGMAWAAAARDEGAPPAAQGEETWVAMRPVSPDWFRTLEMPIVRGRALNEADRRGTEDVAVVDERAAEALWPGQNPLGRRVMLKDGEEDVDRPFRVVGVVGATRQSIFDGGGEVMSDDIQLVAYFPYGRQATSYIDWQIGFRMRNVFLVRTDRSASDIAPEIRRLIASFDPELVVTVVPFEDTVGSPLAERRFYMGMLLLFGGLTLVLVASGVFAVMAYSVSRKTRELGIRLALGARAAELKRAELARGLRLGLMGLVIGAAGATWLTRFIASLLYDVTPVDPGVYSLVGVVVMIVVLAAAYVPARRAASTEPMTSLRTE